MTNLVVISFPTEELAMEASHKLAEAEGFGSITVYEKVMVRKDLDGKVTVLESNTTDGLRTLTGMALGTLGAFAGPIGLVIGIFTGALAGAAVEADYFDFAEDFTEKVIEHLQPGTVVIVAEIYEEDPSLLDEVLEPLGGTISRSNLDYVHDDYVDGQIKKIEDEIAADRNKLKSALAADKASIQERITQLKERRKKRIAELKQRQNTVIAKIRTLANDQKKARLMKNISRHEEKVAELEEKLKKTEQHTK
ncbi:DUF1269 domain-containing protein [Puia dinghuensis]|uniref:DUF1269 domain-containing protein n=1 Tax=Puia dinghuensis TaxID=1792502 RepID=A0A8J2UDB4_9BACT|nr:DUF1269 domain-containing protein [Puia dinghuensis]GGB01990.1 hypothetical protein GCM10011511_26540 [Puia dinghuensis]